MGLEELKAQAHTLIEGFTSEESLTEIFGRLAENPIPYVDPKYEAGIQKGIKEIEEGKGIPLEQFNAQRLAWRKAHNLL